MSFLSLPLAPSTCAPPRPATSWCWMLHKVRCAITSLHCLQPTATLVSLPPATRLKPYGGSCPVARRWVSREEFGVTFFFHPPGLCKLQQANPSNRPCRRSRSCDSPQTKATQALTSYSRGETHERTSWLLASNPEAPSAPQPWPIAAPHGCTQHAPHAPWSGLALLLLLAHR